MSPWKLAAFGVILGRFELHAEQLEMPVRALHEPVEASDLRPASRRHVLGCQLVHVLVADGAVFRHEAHKTRLRQAPVLLDQPVEFLLRLPRQRGAQDVGEPAVGPLTNASLSPDMKISHPSTRAAADMSIPLTSLPGASLTRIATPSGPDAS
jgi:hypothetical protein